MWEQLITLLATVALVAFLIAATVIGLLVNQGLEAQGCPFCARGYAVFKRGRDLVCWRCKRDIDARIRSTEGEGKPPRPRILR